MDTTELQNQAIEIRDAENEGENTALRVGTMLLAIIDAFANIVDTDTLAQILEQYAMVTSAGGPIEPLQSRCIFLASMGTELDNVNGENWTYTPVNGHIIFSPEGNGRLQVVGQPGNLSVRSNTLYINSHSGHAYKWDPAEFKMVEITDTNLPTVITYKNTPAFSQVAIGESYVFQSQSSGPKIAIKISSSETYSFLPDPKKIYAFRDIRQAMLWKPSNQTWISIGNSVEIVDNLTEGGRNKSLSAEQGKILNQRISENQSQIQGLVDDMDAAEASSAVSAPSARIVKEIYVNLKKLFDPESGLAGIAFLGDRPTWENVAKRKYTLSYGTLIGCRADVAAGQVNEGALRIKLTPTQASYAFTSVTVNGESASTTATGDADGSVYLDIIVNGNITVAATAISGRAVNFNGGDGATIGAAGVAIGQDLDTTITANEHFTLPSSITVKIGNTNVAHTYTRAQDNKTATLHIDAANITGDLTITCTAVEDAHVTIAISGSDFVVKQGNAQLSNGSKVYNGSAAQTLTIEPASGYKFSTQPSADKGTMTNNGPYEASSLEIGTSVSGTLTITAAGAALETFSIDLSGLVGVTSSNLAESILEGSPYSTTLSKTDASAAGSVIIGTCTMGNESIAPQSGSTISVAHVMGNIVIAASVGVQPSLIHSYDMAIDTDANNKRSIADTGDMGSFPLYNSEDAGFDTETFGSGWYGNGSYTPNRNGGFVKYGNPVLGLSAGDDFSIVLKDLFVYPKAQNINPSMTIGFNKDQARIKFYPEREVNRNLDSEVGQFELSVWRNATSGAIGNGDYVQLNIKKWTTNTSYFGSSGKFPCTREKIAGTDTYTHTYHLMMTFVASTLKATAYLIDIDNVNNTVTVTNGGSLTMEANLKITGLGFKQMSELGGLDIYNYAVAENNIAGLFTNNN